MPGSSWGQSFVTTALVFGVWFSYAVFFVAMLESFDWSRGAAAMAFSAGSVVQAASSPLVGMLTDRWGPRIVVVGGLAAIALGLGGLQPGAGTVAPDPAVRRRRWLRGRTGGTRVARGAPFPVVQVRRRGTIIGFAFAGMGLGIKVMGPLSQSLMSRLGWRHAFVALGRHHCPARPRGAADAAQPAQRTLANGPTAPTRLPSRGNPGRRRKPRGPFGRPCARGTSGPWDWRRSSSRWAFFRYPCTRSPT